MRARRVRPGLVVASALIVSACRIVDTKMDKARVEVDLLSDAVEQYHQERGGYPSTEEGLGVLVGAGLLRKIPDDPWQHAYEYRSPGTKGSKPFDVWSYGADGRPGGEGPDKDIGNW